MRPATTLFRSSHPQRHQGFTLIELLVVVSLVALLIALLLPSLAKGREQVRMAQCLSNQRQMGQGVAIYQQTSKGYLLPGTSLLRSGTGPTGKTYWLGFLEDAMGGQAWRRAGAGPSTITMRIWFCPSNMPKEHAASADVTYKFESYYSRPGYGLSEFWYTNFYEVDTNGDGVINTSDDFSRRSYREGDLKRNPSMAVAVMELNKKSTNLPGAGLVRPYNFDPVAAISTFLGYVEHNEGGNFLFLDGHAAPRRYSLSDPVYRAWTTANPNGKVWWNPWL